MMTEEEKIKNLESLYNQLKEYKHKTNYHILFNLIHAKVAFGMPNYSRSLYLDAKKFTEAYIKAADTQDYGYDEILTEKILKVISHLERKQQLAILYHARRMMSMHGYDADCLLDEIKDIQMKIAWKGGLRKKIYAGCLWLSAYWWALLLSYFVYVLLIIVILLPAPCEWMQLFVVEYKAFSDCGMINYIMNGLAFIIGDENISPQITPIGLCGISVYIIGKLLFYLIIGNFVLRKMEEYITLK